MNSATRPTDAPRCPLGGQHVPAQAACRRAPAPVQLGSHCSLGNTLGTCPPLVASVSPSVRLQVHTAHCAGFFELQPHPGPRGLDPNGHHVRDNRGARAQGSQHTSTLLTLGLDTHAHPWTHSRSRPLFVHRNRWWVGPGLSSPHGAPPDTWSRASVPSVLAATASCPSHRSPAFPPSPGLPACPPSRAQRGPAPFAGFPSPTSRTTSLPPLRAYQAPISGKAQRVHWSDRRLQTSEHIPENSSGPFLQRHQGPGWWPGPSLGLGIDPMLKVLPSRRHRQGSSGPAWFYR